VTPEKKIFPITFDHHQRLGLFLHGWVPEYTLRSIVDNPRYPKELVELANTSPQKLTFKEKIKLSDAFELALRKVPVLDFYCLYETHEYSNYIFSGVYEGAPFRVNIGTQWDNSTEWFLWNTYKLHLNMEDVKMKIRDLGFGHIIKDIPVSDPFTGHVYNYKEDSTSSPLEGYIRMLERDKEDRENLDDI